MRKRRQQLLERLVGMCDPEHVNVCKDEIEYTELTNTIANEIVGWGNTAKYSDYVEFSADTFDYYLQRAETLDLNTCMATLICIQMEQSLAYTNVIEKRIKSGALLKVAKRLREIAPV